MADELKNYQSGAMGNPFAPGAGQIGYEQHKRRQAQEAARLRAAVAAAPKRGNAPRSRRKVSSKSTVIIVLLMMMAGVALNASGALSYAQRAILFSLGAIMVALVARYWETIVKLGKICLTVAILGGIGYLLFFGPA